jgi:hypothetical protein
MLGRGFRTHFGSLARARPQLGNARDRGVIIQTVVNEKASHHSAGSALAAPAVEVNNSAGVNFASDASQYPVISRLVDHVHIGNRLREVTDLVSGALARRAQCLLVRLEPILRPRQIDDRVDARVDEQLQLLRCLLSRACTRILAGEEPPRFNPPRVQQCVVRPPRRLID